MDSYLLYLENCMRRMDLEVLTLFVLNITLTAEIVMSL